MHHTRAGQALGLILTLLFGLILVGGGAYLLWQRHVEARAAATTAAATAAQQAADETRSATPRPTASQRPATTGGADTPAVQAPGPVPSLPAPGTYPAKDGLITIDISEYAGYAGLIAANQGLAGGPDSVFTKQFGLNVRLQVSEGAKWADLQRGEFAASATTVDVLAVQGRSWGVSVPVLIGFSRGADAVLARKDIRRINDLVGRVVAVAPYDESEFFLRYLAQEAGIAVEPLDALTTPVPAGRIGVVYAEDAFKACDLFAAELPKRSSPLAGCVGWAPRTGEVVDASGGAAKFLVTNRNLLVVADILVVNRGWAAAHVDQVAKLVQGVLIGNRMVREQPASAAPWLQAAFAWDAAKAKAELAKVHLANLPENQAFFAGTIDAAGSYGGIFQSAVLAYGLRDAADPDRFHDKAPLAAAAASGSFAGETPSITPLRSGATTSALEGNALLTKDVRFQFEPNSDRLDLAQATNLAQLDTIKRMLNVSPGSQVLLRGHVEGSRVEEFRKQGGEPFLRKMSLAAMELSKRRASSVRDHLVQKLGIEASRVETVGRGWEEPLGGDKELDRRVEVQWFTLE